MYYNPPLEIAATEEGELHFLLLLVESASGHRSSVTHLPKVRPGGVVRHRVADHLRSSEE
jgi:hypothetical protein